MMVGEVDCVGVCLTDAAWEQAPPRAGSRRTELKLRPYFGACGSRLAYPPHLSGDWTLQVETSASRLKAVRADDAAVRTPRLRGERVWALS
jgi:hypothetical protein